MTIMTTRNKTKQEKCLVIALKTVFLAADRKEPKIANMQYVHRILLQAKHKINQRIKFV